MEFRQYRSNDTKFHLNRSSNSRGLLYNRGTICIVVAGFGMSSKSLATGTLAPRLAILGADGWKVYEVLL